MNATMRYVVYSLLLMSCVAWAETIGWRHDATGAFPDAKPVGTWSATENVIWKTRLAKWSNACPVVLKDRGHVLQAAGGDTLEVICRLEPGDAKACGLKVRRSDDGARAVTLRFDGKMLDVAGTRLPLQLDRDERALALHVFLDRSVLEVFADGGRECITRVIYPGQADLGIEVFAEGGTARLESMDVWEMKSVW